MDEATAIKVIGLPFLDTIEWGDSDIMEFLARISVSDPDALMKLLSRESLTAPNDPPVQILYLEIRDPAAAARLADQVWVKNGLQYLENSTLNYLQETALASPRFFNYMIEEHREWIPLQNGLDNSALYRLVKWSHFDEDTVLRLVAMPFLERIEIQDGQVVTWLYELASTDPEAAQRILSRPIVQDGVTDEESIYLALYYLEETLPETAAALQALPWIQDGIEHVPWQPQLSSINVIQDIEAHKVISLVTLATRSPEFLIELTTKGWMQDNINEREALSLGDFDVPVSYDPEAALRVLRLPLLDNHDREVYRAIDRLVTARWESREAFEEELEKLEAAGGS